MEQFLSAAILTPTAHLTMRLLNLGEVVAVVALVVAVGEEGGVNKQWTRKNLHGNDKFA